VPLTLSVNQYHTATDFPSNYPARMASSSQRETSFRPLANGHASSEEEEKESMYAVWSRGGSCIVNPLGEILAGPLWDEEGIIYADVSDGDILP